MTALHDPSCPESDPNPRWLRADHDARCLIWASDDPTTCDCDDDQGYAIYERERVELAAALARCPVTVVTTTHFLCDDDPEEHTAS